MNDNGNPASRKVSAIRAIARGAKWLVPLAALTAIAFSLLRLNVTPERWQSETVCEAAAELGRFVPDPVACIALASVILLYWGARERKDAAALVGILAGWFTGIPGMSTVGQWAVKGAVYMFATIKRKVYEQILADGRSQGHVEGRSEGRAEGRSEGRAEGRSEGRAVGRVEGRSEGRQQTNAEWDAWLERRTKTGVFVPDDNDPPPSQTAD